MPKGMVFWVLMIVWAVFVLWGSAWAPPGSSWDRRWVGGSVLIFILLFILGWQVFGFAVQ